MLLISSGNKYIPEDRPPLEKKPSRCINRWTHKIKSVTESCLISPSENIIEWRRENSAISVNVTQKLNKKIIQHSGSCLPTGSDETFPSA